MMTYAITRYPTPVFNTPDLTACFGGADRDTLLLDEQGLMRTVETVLFPNTRVQLLEQVALSTIWKIKTNEYAHEGNLYIDNRFLTVRDNAPHERQVKLPPIADILKTMSQLENTRYIWGGNYPEGISQLPEFYPSKTNLSTLDPLIQDTWRLKGLDCSGLLYYATNGFTPRNTSALVKFGNSVNIEGKNAASILEQLQNLDLIVWKGHVVCVYDKNTTIESRLPKGVLKTNSFERLTEIMKERKPVNAWDSTLEPHFVIQRWYRVRLQTF
jgi:hypothetical protein